MNFQFPLQIRRYEQYVPNMALILLLHDLYLYVVIGMHVCILYTYTLEHYVHTYIHARTFVRM